MPAGGIPAKLAAAQDQLALDPDLRRHATGVVGADRVYRGRRDHPGAEADGYRARTRRVGVLARSRSTMRTYLVIGRANPGQISSLHERTLPDLKGTLTRPFRRMRSRREDRCELLYRARSRFRRDQSTCCARCAVRASRCAPGCRWKCWCRCACGTGSLRARAAVGSFWDRSASLGEMARAPRSVSGRRGSVRRWRTRRRSSPARRQRSIAARDHRPRIEREAESSARDRAGDPPSPAP